MRASHQEALVADNRFAAARDRAEIERNMLANDAVSADAKAGVFAAVTKMLRRSAKDCKWKDDRSVANNRATVDDNMRLQLNAISERCL
jgi:hypothetical protein